MSVMRLEGEGSQMVWASFLLSIGRVDEEEIQENVELGMIQITQDPSWLHFIKWPRMAELSGGMSCC